ncbi:glycosyltransferase [Tessaracoccus sp. Y1736]
MKIAVIAVAAEVGGALTVLEGIHQAAAAFPEHEWTFFTGKPCLPTAPPVTVVRLAWVKRSWLHRLWFEWVDAPSRLRHGGFDAILSLQNTLPPRINCSSAVYVHQAIPFSEHRFRLLETPRLWAYQNLIGWLIRRSAMRADTVIVQTVWMRTALQRITNGDTTIRVAAPPSDWSIQTPPYVPTAANRKRFLYPASPEVYKDHKTLLEACSILLNRGFSDFEVLLTLTREELRRLESDLPIKNVIPLGRVSRDALHRLYATSVLVFPSFVETVGLPLVEAASTSSFIVAADTPFANEVLCGYPNARFFDVGDPVVLADHMFAIATGATSYVASSERISGGQGSWKRVCEIAIATSSETGRT